MKLRREPFKHPAPNPESATLELCIFGVRKKLGRERKKEKKERGGGGEEERKRIVTLKVFHQGL